MRFSLSVATLSPPLLSGRLFVTSRRSSAMLPLTSSRKCPLLLPPPPLRSLMSFPTARSSPLAMSVSAALRLFSSLPSSEWKPVDSRTARAAGFEDSRASSCINSVPIVSCQATANKERDCQEEVPQHGHLAAFPARSHYSPAIL